MGVSFMEIMITSPGEKDRSCTIRWRLWIPVFCGFTFFYTSSSCQRKAEIFDWDNLWRPFHFFNDFVNVIFFSVFFFEK